MCIKMLTRLIWLAVSSGLLCACSSISPKSIQTPQSETVDRFNRASFAFNQRFGVGDTKPAKSYSVFNPITLANNVLDNVHEVPDMVNHLLQGRPRSALDDGMRLAFNSTFGLAGLFDVASEMGLPKIKEDFGQTLGYWGVGTGTYVVLPFMGPTSTRDLVAKPIDASVDPLNYLAYGWVAKRFIPEAKPELAEYKPTKGDAYTQQRDAWLTYRAREIAR